MLNTQSIKNHDISRVVFLSLFIAVLLAILYIGIMYLWIVVTVSTDVPNYVIKKPLRQFFVLSLIIAVFAYFPLKLLCKRESNYRTYCMMVGAFMTIIGVAGMLVILPLFGKLSGSGGLIPDLGHTLTYDNFTGALWLFFSLTGFIPYINGYSATSKPRPAISRRLLLFVTGVPTFYISGLVYGLFSFISESGSMRGMFLFSTIVTIIVIFIIRIKS